MDKFVYIVALLYTLFVVCYIGFSEFNDSFLAYAEYVPPPHFSQDTPEAFKQLFLSVSRDGENVVTPPSGDTIVFHGSRDLKEVALTFDADMTPWMRDQLLSGNVQSYYNQQLIDYLKNTDTKATLFLTGMWIELYPDAARDLASNPLFELGNHSYSHPSFAGYCYGLAQLPQDGAQSEIGKTQQLLFNLTNKQNTLFRFPGGCYSQDELSLLHQDGIQAIQWDIVGDDGFNDNTDAIVANVLDNVQNGSIIVMHMNGYPNDPKTSDAIPEIVTALKDRGFKFVTVSELLAPEVSDSSLNSHLQTLTGYILPQVN